MEAVIGAANGLVGGVLSLLSNELVEAFVASTQLGLNYTKMKRDLLFTQGLLQEAQTRGKNVSDNLGLRELLQELSAKADEAEDALDELHYFIIQDQLDGTHDAVPDLGDDLRGHARHGCHALRHTIGNCLACFSCSRMKGPDDGVAAAVITDNPANAILNPGSDGNDSPVAKLSFDRVTMSKRIKSVIEEIQSLCDPVSKLLQLIPPNSTTTIVTQRHRVTGSTIVQDTLYGRRAIFGKTVDDILTTATEHCETLSVLPIVGPGGIGKTTFTQHMYNDTRIDEHFTIKVWVCVSIDFDVVKLSQQILSCIPATENEKNMTGHQTANLDQLQISITHRLKSKRFLVVFDDIWECNQEDWEKLLAPFMKVETKGSMVLVTTRFPSIAELVGTTGSVALQGLDHDDFMKFFEELIFGGNKPEYYQEDLAGLANDIAMKLKGSPLAARTVGRLLKRNPCWEHWMRVLENDEWHNTTNENDIMPSLKISYDYLPFHLKKLFPYFSLFPEDYRFTSLEILYFWIAIGMIEKDESYMEELVDNGFLVRENDSLEDQYYVLHDLLHELSRIVSSQECLNIYSSVRFRADVIPESVRHLSITMEDRCEVNFRGEMIRLKDKLDIANLRSLMVFREYNETIVDILNDTFEEIAGLRVLFIALKSPESLPHNFPKLIHLRYLKIIRSSILSNMTLPSTLSRFYHLKLLDLRYWSGSDKLPSDISRLTNLCHLFSEEELHSNVPRVGKMKFLHELKKFCVEKESVGYELKELGALTKLGGRLSIYNLERVTTKEEASEAKLVLKRDLKELKLVLGKNQQATESDVLDGLEPQPNLKALDIRDRGGKTSPPCWLYANIISIQMLQCLHLEGVSWGTLPPFGQLLHLRELTLISISGVGQIKPGFGGDPNQSFMRLKRIVLDGLPELTEWIGVPGTRSFSRLEYARCNNCPELCGLPFLNSSGGSYINLSTLEILGCPKLPIPSMPHTPTPKYFSLACGAAAKFYYCGKELRIDRYEGELALHNLDKVETMSIRGVSHISLIEFNKLKSLTRLDVSHCSMVTCHGLQDLTWLQSLSIGDCGNFFRWPMEGTIRPLPSSLTELEVRGEPSMQSLALLSNLTSLATLRLVDCVNLKVDGFNPHITANLKELVVYRWDGDRCPQSVVANIISEILPPATAADSFFFQLEILEVDCMSAVLVAPLCSLLAATLRTLRISFDHQIESFTEEQVKALELLTSLHKLEFHCCYALKSLSEALDSLPSLKELQITECPKLRLLPEEHLSTSQQKTTLVNCSAESNEDLDAGIKERYPDLRIELQGWW